MQWIYRSVGCTGRVWLLHSVAGIDCVKVASAVAQTEGRMRGSEFFHEPSSVAVETRLKKGSRKSPKQSLKESLMTTVSAPCCYGAVYHRTAKNNLYCCSVIYLGKCLF